MLSLNNQHEQLLEVEHVLELDYWTIREEAQEIVAWDVKTRRWVPANQGPLSRSASLRGDSDLEITGRREQVKALFINDQWKWEIPVEAERFVFEPYDQGPMPGSLRLLADGVPVAEMATGTGSWTLLSPPKGRWFDQILFHELSDRPYREVHFNPETRGRASALAERAL